MRKKLLSILALLCLTVSSAWAQAQQTYTVTFSWLSDEHHNKTFNNATLQDNFDLDPNDIFETVDYVRVLLDFSAYVAEGGGGKVSIVSRDINNLKIGITGAFEGTARIRCQSSIYYLADKEAGTYATAREEIYLYVTCVANTAVEAVSLPTTATLALGKTVTLTPTFTPNDATYKDVTWTTSDANVATVSSDGLVTAKGAGTATITVTATNGTEDTSDDKTATCQVTVEPKWEGETLATHNETLDAITVSANATLTINGGVTVTVNGGIYVEPEATLTIAGSGTLVVKGTDGGDGDENHGGGGFAAIRGNVIVLGGTVNATGGNGGDGDEDDPTGYQGGDGGAAISGNISVQGGTVNATGGNGGNGGNGSNTGGAAGYGGNAFAGTLTYYGGTVNATGGTGGSGGTGTNGAGESFGPQNAFANDVNFQAARILTDGTNAITSVLNQRTVVITEGPASYNGTTNQAGDAFWSTFYSEAGNYQAPEGTQVFAVNLDGTTITMIPIEDRIAKSGEGVVLKKTTTGNFTMTWTATAPAGDFSGNNLDGTMTQINTTGANDYYVLGNGSGGVGFYKLAESGTIGANKAYLTYSGTLARGYFLFGDATEISATLNDNGEMTKEKCYDLQGRRVAQPQKGLYIVNGKKVVIK